jgi:hypothetical protein
VATTTLVSGDLSGVARRLERDYGPLRLVALLPLPEDSWRDRFELVIAPYKPWASPTESRRKVLLDAVKALRETDSLAAALTDRVTIITEDDPLATAIEAQYADHALPAAMEGALLGRDVSGGTLVALRRSLGDVSAADSSPPLTLTLDDINWLDIAERYLSAELSRSRVEAFEAGLIEARRRAATLETIISSTGGLVDEQTTRVEAGVFVRRLLLKAPFSDTFRTGHHFAPYDPWPLAVAFEQHLIDRIVVHATSVAGHERAETSTTKTWEALRRAVSSTMNDYQHPVILLSPETPVELKADILEVSWRQEQNPNAHTSMPWFIGTPDGIRVLSLSRSRAIDRNLPGHAVVVFDLAQFGTIRRYRGMSGTSLDTTIRTLTEREVQSATDDPSLWADRMEWPREWRELIIRSHVQLSATEYIEFVPHPESKAVVVKLA